VSSRLRAIVLTTEQSIVAIIDSLVGGFNGVEWHCCPVTEGRQ
jgi:hypothetical protein